jgi:hypothetical protein
MTRSYCARSSVQSELSLFQVEMKSACQNETQTTQTVNSKSEFMEVRHKLYAYCS